jgi:hypothetical protein
LGYEFWKRAWGEISWEYYLRKLLELQETGFSIREVIEKEMLTSPLKVYLSFPGGNLSLRV